jgi:hypothetical protein
LVAFFATVKTSPVCILLSCPACIQSVVYKVCVFLNFSLI